MSNKNEYTNAGKALQQQHNNGPDSQINRHRAFLQARLDKISKWVRQGVRAEALVRFALLDMSDPKADKLRAADPQSIYLGLLACAVTGLEPGALKGEAFLVPFAGKAQFMPGWKGLVKQARRSEHVDTIVANVVREADLFDIDLGTANTVIHKPARKDRGEVIGAYAIAGMKGGFREIEWMDREDLDAVQRVATARAASPAWKDWEDQMQRKSVIRRLAKRLPLGADYFVAMALEQTDDQLPIIDIETDGEGSASVAGAGSAPQVASSSSNGRTPEVRTDRAIDTTAEERPAQQSQAPATATEQPKEKSSKKDAYTKPPAAKPEQKPAAKPEPKTAAEPAPDIKPPPVKDPASKETPTEGLEERACFTCGVPIEVPPDAPGGQLCDACRNS